MGLNWQCSFACLRSLQAGQAGEEEMYRPVLFTAAKFKIFGGNLFAKHPDLTSHEPGKERRNLNQHAISLPKQLTTQPNKLLSSAVHSRNPGEGEDNLQTGQSTPKTWEEADGLPWWVRIPPVHAEDALRRNSSGTRGMEIGPINSLKMTNGHI